MNAEFLQTVKENTSFLLICLLIFAVLMLAAWAAQKLLIRDRRQLSGAKTISFVAIFGAIAAILMYIEVPLFFAPAFYQIDFSEVPILICTFYLGPVAGVACEMLKIILKLFLKGTTTAFVGDFANFVVGCALVLPASIIYHCRKTRATAIWGMVAGTLIMTVFGSAFNAIYLLPKFAQLYGMPLDTIIAMGTKIRGGVSSVTTFVMLCVAPLNLLKGAMVSVLTMLLYKKVARPLFGIHK